MRRPVWLFGRFGDPDATHSLRPPRRAPPRVLTLVLGAILLATVFGVLLAFRQAAPPAGPAPATLPLADEAALLGVPTETFSLWRLSAAPRIVVAIFPSLHAQAMALNRVAAFIERPGVPHDRLLDDGALKAATGPTPEAFDTYYYGHDYRAADLARFYATADRDHDRLNEAELTLRGRLNKAGFFNADRQDALITLPPHGSGLLDPSARATILHHELSHGAYFTDAAYGAYVAAFWLGLTEPERAAFRHFLDSEGYDTGNDDLMRNETQAYLAFTGDHRMFDPERVAMPEVLSLRRVFLAGQPLPWLRRDADSQ